MLKRALKEGHVKVKWTKQSISGSPGSGKSSFMKLLLNEDLPDCHHSTPVATVPEIRMVTTTSVIVDKGTQSFIKVDVDLMKKMLAEIIKKGVKTCSSLSVQSDDSSKSFSAEAQILNNKKTKHLLKLLLNLKSCCNLQFLMQPKKSCLCYLM